MFGVHAPEAPRRRPGGGVRASCHATWRCSAGRCSKGDLAPARPRAWWRGRRPGPAAPHAARCRVGSRGGTPGCPAVVLELREFMNAEDRDLVDELQLRLTTAADRGPATSRRPQLSSARGRRFKLRRPTADRAVDSPPGEAARKARRGRRRGGSRTGRRGRRTGGPGGSFSRGARLRPRGGLPAPRRRLHPDPPWLGPDCQAAPRRDPHALRLARRQPSPPGEPRGRAGRAPKHVVTKGSTRVLSPAEARKLLDSIDTGSLVGLRDRALFSVMLYSFARVSAVLGMRRQDYFRQGSRGWLRLHENGGGTTVPAHHRAARGPRRPTSRRVNSRTGGRRCFRAWYRAGERLTGDR